MLVGRVVDDELEEDADLSIVRRPDEGPDLVERAVAPVNAPVVRDVVPIVAERGGEERQQPEAVDPEVLQVVESGRQAGKVTDAVAVAVKERADVRLVNDRVLVPERIRGAILEPGIGSQELLR